MYITATFLDPTLAYLIMGERDKGIRMIKLMHDALVSDAATEVNREMEHAAETVETNPFGFGAISAPILNPTHRCHIDDEIKEYFDEVTVPNLELKAIEFWHRTKKYPTLKRLAQSILSVPASSAGVERMFSQLSLATAGHKGSAVPKSMRRNVLLHYNKKFISL